MARYLSDGMRNGGATASDVVAQGDRALPVQRLSPLTGIGVVYTRHHSKKNERQ